MIRQERRTLDPKAPSIRFHRLLPPTEGRRIHTALGFGSARFGSLGGGLCLTRLAGRWALLGSVRFGSAGERSEQQCLRGREM